MGIVSRKQFQCHVVHCKPSVSANLRKIVVTIAGVRLCRRNQKKKPAPDKSTRGRLYLRLLGGWGGSRLGEFAGEVWLVSQQVTELDSREISPLLCFTQPPPLAVFCQVLYNLIL